MGCWAVTLDHTGEGVTHVASPPSREDLEDGLTEAKGVDADLRRIIDTIPVLAWCNLPDGSNEFHNQRWYDYTGLSQQEASGWGWRAAFQPDDLDPLMETWTALQSWGEAGEIEARMRRYDGEYRWFLLRFEPLRDELSNIGRWYGTNTDIDDLKRAQVGAAGPRRASSNHRRHSASDHRLESRGASSLYESRGARVHRAVLGGGSSRGLSRAHLSSRGPREAARSTAERTVEACSVQPRTTCPRKRRQVPLVFHLLQPDVGWGGQNRSLVCDGNRR